MELGLIITFLIVMWAGLRHDIKGKKQPAKKSNGGTLKEGSTEEYVYIIANPSHRTGIFKIGLTTQVPEKRMKQLFSTGVPTPFQVCFLIKTDNCRVLEKELHKKYALQRISTNREFFRLSKEDMDEIRRDYIKQGDYVGTFAINTALELPGSSVSVPFEVNGTIV